MLSIDVMQYNQNLVAMSTSHGKHAYSCYYQRLRSLNCLHASYQMESGHFLPFAAMLDPSTS